MLTRTAFFGWGFLLLMLLLLFVPLPVRVAPAVEVRLVDEFNRPLADTGVSELWRNTSIERRDHLEQTLTGRDGVVRFPGRSSYASMAERMVGCMAHLYRESLAASCGSNYTVLAAGDLKELAREETRHGLLEPREQITITVKRCEAGDPSVC